MSASSLLRRKVTETLEPLVTGAGYELEDVAVTQAGRRRLLRLVVDRDGGVDLDAVADLSREISEALDATGVFGDAPFVLEVSSPGVDRPLTEPRHWRRAVGRLVTAPLAGGGEVAGRVVAVDDARVTFDVDGTPTAVALADLGRGRVQVEFARREEES